MSYRFINFFSKNGTNITPTVNADDIFEFSISLEKTSAGLFSTEHLFLLEEVLYETEGEFTQKPKQVFVPVLIQILKYLRDWGYPVKKEDLRKFFVFNANGDEFFVTNFLNNNSDSLSSWKEKMDQSQSLNMILSKYNTNLIDITIDLNEKFNIYPSPLWEGSAREFISTKGLVFYKTIIREIKLSLLI